MSDSIEMFLELLPINSELQKKDNPLRKVLDKTVGEWLDNFNQPFEQLFLTTATGGWLDAHGKDYGVARRIDESDESYRQRIVYEKLDNLTARLLSDVYNVDLYAFVEDYNPKENTLTSDNPYINHLGYVGDAEQETKEILNKKFVIDNGVDWI